ncbi:sirohydrochlorin ferrochelatase [Enterococcus sp. PF1-24]|uniref:sirohydrochlorin chelatase n=1 Tax=unclassified Enterococcus TaxID=2608891 RepID=UPI0024745D40|nr:MULTISPECIES: CbiX/SirB N-terminal domain-containing protein [unclassified Enterococcus]MDH6363227.1 sirohydrochlorin ferrochelatase [Enterococcus sp. PFB1-1]MDH6400472.1 sirohydrochlorin ferrochelatase [Enterococcus sp. PF1-24]
MKKTGIVYVLHGRKTGVATSNVETIKELYGNYQQLQRIAFLEGDEHALEDVIQELLAQATMHFVFVPVLLFPATHAREDLPNRVAATLKASTATYEILATLGSTNAISEFIIQQLKKVTLAEKRDVLLIAHGTPHFPEPQQELVAIAKKVSQATGYQVFTGNYLGEPSYQTFAKEHSDVLIVQRVFLSEGFIARKITRWFKAERGEKDLILATLQDSNYLKLAIMERLTAAGFVK